MTVIYSRDKTWQNGGCDNWYAKQGERKKERKQAWDQDKEEELMVTGNWVITIMAKYWYALVFITLYSAK